MEKKLLHREMGGTKTLLVPPAQHLFSPLAGSTMATSTPNSSFDVQSRSALRISSKEDTWLNTHCTFGVLQSGNSQACMFEQTFTT